MSKIEKKTLFFQVRISPSEKLKMERIKRELNIPLSVLFRAWLKDLEEMEKYFLIGCGYYRKIFIELNKIGNNINQIARKVNAENKVGEEVLKKLDEIYKELKNIRQKIGGLDLISSKNSYENK
ncbi:MAG: MobC family plasmid mobilization relaxosome protein [Nautiliaceae bacterium]